MVLRLIKGLLILGALSILWVMYIPIKREVTFGDYSVSYPFYLFNHSFCYLYTHGHCFTNKEYKANAYHQLNRKLCAAYQLSKAPYIKQQLELAIASDERYKLKYKALAIKGEIQADSICAYQKELFIEIALK